MANVDLYGYRSGRSEIRPVKISNTAVSGGIKPGDLLKDDAVGPEFFTQAGAGDLPRCVALGRVAEADIPATDGDVEILAEFSEDAQYEYPPASGTLTTSLEGKTCDLGGAQSIDPTASTDDVVTIVKVDTSKNTALVKFNFSASRSGVV